TARLPCVADAPNGIQNVTLCRFIAVATSFLRKSGIGCGYKTPSLRLSRVLLVSRIVGLAVSRGITAFDRAGLDTCCLVKGHWCRCYGGLAWGTIARFKPIACLSTPPINAGLAPALTHCISSVGISMSVDARPPHHVVGWGTVIP